MKKLGFIGMGNMAQALVTGMVASKKVDSKSIFAYAPNQEKLKTNCQRLGITPCPSLAVLSQQCDVLFIACKPNRVESVIDDMGEKLVDKHIVSVAASWDFEIYSRILPASAKIQCIMPNTPVSVREGVLLVAKENNWDIEARTELIDVLGGLGKVVELPTKLMGVGMALSGCGPAFMDMIIEAFADGGVKNGLPRKEAYELVCQTMIGSAKLQQKTGLHPGQLKDMVCSPGGTTIKGVASLEEAGLRTACIKAVDRVLE